MNLFPVRLVLTLTLLLALPLMASSARELPTAPGHYAEWAGKLDEVDIIQSFHLRDYGRILVLPLDIREVKFPDDNTRRPMEKALPQIDATFVEALDHRIPNRMHVKAEGASAGTPHPAGTMILRARLVELDPGQRAARFFTKGFAGGAAATVVGEMVDGATGRTLFRFRHRRYIGSGGFLGGQYIGLMKDAAEGIAEDLAVLVKAFWP